MWLSPALRPPSLYETNEESISKLKHYVVIVADLELTRQETRSKLTRNIQSRGKLLGAQTAARVAGGYATKSQACNVM